MTPSPKPPKPERGTRATQAHWDLVKQLTCVICGSFPCELHHCKSGRYARRKSSDFDVIPLCWLHHWQVENHRKEWDAVYGPDTDYLPRVAAQIAELKARTV